MGWKQDIYLKPGLNYCATKSQSAGISDQEEGTRGGTRYWHTGIGQNYSYY